MGILPFKATFLTTEGEVAHSYAEALIDLYWHEQDIPHKFQVGIGSYVADWVIDENTVVEYAGFIESRMFGKRYKARLETKLAFYKTEGMDVLVIYPVDLNNYRPKGTPYITKDIVSGDINWSKQPLGKMSDTELARRLGVGQTTVSRWRGIFGIPTFAPLPRDWSGIPLGKEFDSVIAGRLGLSKQTIRRARIERGISSCRSRHAA